VDAAILAGGRARRFGGRDKSALHVGPTTIFHRQRSLLADVADQVFVIAGHSGRFEGSDVRVVPDRLPDAGALGGIYTALSVANSPYVLVLACDLPFVSAPLLARLSALAADDDWDAIVPRSRDGLQPLCAVYARRLAPRIRERIESGHLKIADLFGAVRTRELSPEEIATCDPDERLFFNVNTRDDWERALLLSQRDRPSSDR
jgi:molybdenum cofactor guanylyltransferase